MSKVVLLITDSLGVGALPNAAEYGDAGADTFGHIVEGCPDLKIPNLIKLGMGNIEGVAGGKLAVGTDFAAAVGADNADFAAAVGADNADLAAAHGADNIDFATAVGSDNADLAAAHGADNIDFAAAVGADNTELAAAHGVDGEMKELMGCYGKMDELSAGKDTTTGHWEIAGIKTDVPFKTYPDGFPADFMAAYEKAIGVECLGNYAASGTTIIEDLGPEHEATGKPIVYTSADSVFQIAVNIDVVPLERLYEMCKLARELLVGDWACGRVIARPYVIKDGKRERTSDRRDYAVTPPADTVLDFVSQAGLEMYGIGKIGDIFNEKGLTTNIHTVSNMDGVDKTIEALGMDFDGFVFTNLVDFDSKYGHRRDVEGYGKCIEEFDQRLPELMEALGEDDIMMITADHGNDPAAPGTDHTREYVPLLVYGKNIKKGVNLGIRKSFADVGATVCDVLGIKMPEIGTSFKNEL